MTYRLEFLPAAQKEWERLDASLRRQFAEKLRERLQTPRIPAHALHGMRDHYKIKLRAAGYRLVYRVQDEVVTVLVIAIGKRKRSEVYEAAKKR